MSCKLDGCFNFEVEGCLRGVMKKNGCMGATKVDLEKWPKHAASEVYTNTVIYVCIDIKF